ncbi:hypothetical protein ACIPY2_06570 [Paenarthrobacter sp. NPDC089675]|uniref:hypothetical protein n=1 Tax=Paenarthrobacter sp. NPDC089675 TaxID=3364376 RepID=UPI00381AAAA2
MTAYRHNNWNQLIGAFVEIRQNHISLRSGYVEDATPDSSVLWLAADDQHNRALFEAAEGHVVWVEPRELEGRLTYRMTRTALHPQLQSHPDNFESPNDGKQRTSVPASQNSSNS